MKLYKTRSLRSKH